MLGANESIAHMFADDGSVLAFLQCVVGGAVGAALGEFDAQFLQ